MKPIFAALLTSMLLLGTYVPGDADGDLLARMGTVNPDLHSYTAALHAHVVLTSFPFIETDLAGTFYHKDPDLDRVEITSGLVGMGDEFSKLYPHAVPPALWGRVYLVTLVGDDGKQTTFKLVPRKSGNVERIDAIVDDRTATISSMRWAYNSGASVTTANTYAMVDGNLLVTVQTGTVDELSYKGNVVSTLDNYVINPNIPDQTFKEQ